MKYTRKEVKKLAVECAQRALWWYEANEGDLGDTHAHNFNPWAWSARYDLTAGQEWRFCQTFNAVCRQHLV